MHQVASLQSSLGFLPVTTAQPAEVWSLAVCLPVQIKRLNKKPYLPAKRNSHNDIDYVSCGFPLLPRAAE